MTKTLSRTASTDLSRAALELDEAGEALIMHGAFRAGWRAKAVAQKLWRKINA